MSNSVKMFSNGIRLIEPNMFSLSVKKKAENVKQSRSLTPHIPLNNPVHSSLFPPKVTIKFKPKASCSRVLLNESARDA